MKKILLYLETMKRGGAERVLNNIASYLSDNYEVILVNDIIYDSKEEYMVDSRVRRYVLGLTKGGIKGNLIRVKKLRKIINDEHPDVILSFKGACNLRMLVSAIGLKARKIVSVRNDPTYEYGRGLVKCAAKILFKTADGCVFQTQEAMNYFQKSVKKKSLVIWNPVADKFYERTWSPSREEIVVVGRLVPQKNPLLAIEVFRLINDDYPDIKLAYYGSGELKSEIIATAKKYGLDQKITVIDNVSNIEDYVSSAKLFLMTSDFEGMPNALMEAMAIGTPCVSTDCPCGGPRAISGDLGESMLAPCRNANALAEKIKSLLESKTKQEQLSEKERKRSSLFRMKYVMKQWETFLFKL